MRNKPFTLLEIIVAMSILAVMAALMASIIHSVPRSWSLQREQADRLAGLVKLEQFADTVLRNAAPFEWRDDYNRERQVFLGSSEVLVAAYLRDSGIGFAALGRRGGEVVLQYRGEPILYWESDPEELLPETLEEEILLTGVAALRFGYAEWESGELEWRSAWNRDYNYIPQGIRFQVEFEDGTRVNYLRRTAGNGYYTSYGRRNEPKL